ncbi:MAG: alpha-glucosidase/alpha-galactosidase [Lentisphaeria bacterium]|nr:alpha-glucosidase/alpha-galactosidase [Lentisphaeria bacterium]
MFKIAIIGAGSIGFSLNFFKDYLLDGDLRERSEIALMDISEERLNHAVTLLKILMRELKVNANISATLNLEEALTDARYIVTVIRAGSVRMQDLEYEIPCEYGVKQVVGDSLGPGGIFRGLRVLKELFKVAECAERAAAPGAIWLNYVNPMSINTIALNRFCKRVRVYGLCHGVQATARGMASYVGKSVDEIVYRCVGINHQAFFLNFTDLEGNDLYPELRRVMNDPSSIPCRKEKVRFELMRHFGYFPTESSGHASEYIPYFRKRESLIEEFCKSEIPVWVGEDGVDYGPMTAGESGAAIRINVQRQANWPPYLQALLDGTKKLNTAPSQEYAMRIISAIENNRNFNANVNVMNQGLIPTLPPGASVEVPCLVNGSGIQPTCCPDYPEQCAALNRNMINVQLLAAAGALERDREKIHYAVAVDPLTAAVCSLREIREMTDKLFEALKEELDPGFF